MGFNGVICPGYAGLGLNAISFQRLLSLTPGVKRTRRVKISGQLKFRTPYLRETEVTPWAALEPVYPPSW